MEQTQPVQKQKPVLTQATAKPAHTVPAKQPVAGAQVHVPVKKKSKWWIWLIGLIVLLAIAGGVYYWFFIG